MTPATTRRRVPTEALRELRQALRVAGAFERPELRTWVEFAALMAAFAMATAGVVAFGLPFALVLVPVAAAALTSAVMLGHEGGHRALSRSRRRNDLMLYLAFPLIGGMSASYWTHKHNVLHHGHPNVASVDEDLDLWPMASSRAHHERSGPAVRWFQRHLQGWAFWPLTALLSASIRLASARHLVGVARSGRVDARWWADVGCLTAHYALWLVVPALALGVWPVLAYFVAIWALVGVALSAVFVPAHVGLPIVGGFEDNWLHQLETTRNLRMPRALAWCFMGLDRQVEHHLFPRVAHRKLPTATRVVRAWAQRWGLPHQTIGYAAALAEVTRLMHRAWDTPVAASTPAAAAVEPS